MPHPATTAEMSIKALPTDTRRLIESTSLIASPVCLVRELADNAIDARASCVDIFISRNTVDKVEVRDNGSGIASVDFGALGRQSHSSKTEASGTGASGPPSLGFRGQGLASANNLGYVTVTTRTHNDAVASTFRLVPNIGGVASDSQKVASARVGTTVNVTCVFSALPVRRKVAVQESSKAIAGIKTLLRSYALARPNLRLSLKILQPLGVASPTEAKLTAPWDYRPTTVGIGSHASMRQAVSALFGAEVARQCQEIVASSKELVAGQSTIAQTLSQTVPERMNSDEIDNNGELNDFVFEAWLPQPGADLAKLKLGSFVSVDGRPISADRYGSTGKKLTTIFTTAFGKSLTALQQYEGYGSPPQPLPQSKLHGLFIRLNIKCPLGSYDANVDSSKTDVLFADERFLCDAFERLCKRVYSATESLRHSQPFGRGSLFPRTPDRTHTATTFSLPASSLNGPSQNTQAARSALRGPSRQPGSGIIDGTPTPASRLHEQGSDPCDAPVRIQIPSRGGGNRRRLVSAPRTKAVRSLRTPPASPVARSRGRTNRMQNHHSPESPDLPGLVSCDGLRQTTISFHGPPNNNNDNDKQRQGTRQHPNQVNEANRLEEEEPAVFGTAPETGGTNTESTLPSFVSARELCTTEPQVCAGPSRVQPRSQFGSPLEQGIVRPHGRLSHAAQPETYGGQSTRSLNVLTSTIRRPSQIMKVDIQQLRRSAVQFARNIRTWEKAGEEGAEGSERGDDRLSPEMADIASIEARLRAAVTAWAAKTMSGTSNTSSIDMGEGPVQVELYLRKSLKQKALMVRSAREE
ncbi:dna mismatch repair protein [Ophiostoma piceae UAMH 11346]|uniref:Dna mismatch repair protein n=1 Tax=Ophiostoma piceae (strain UAMH 11346) TaxID=1262450 RepID=S3D767_OPHP1|nr:dna mismatch repair protein [Ophiostoma piceae UAMH 11346]